MGSCPRLRQWQQNQRRKSRPESNPPENNNQNCSFVTQTPILFNDYNFFLCYPFLTLALQRIQQPSAMEETHQQQTRLLLLKTKNTPQLGQGETNPPRGPPPDQN